MKTDFQEPYFDLENQFSISVTEFQLLIYN